jgi:hypothetical protein
MMESDPFIPSSQRMFHRSPTPVAATLAGNAAKARVE